MPIPFRQALAAVATIMTLWALPAQATDQTINPLTAPFAAMGVAPVPRPAAAQGFTLPDLAEGEIRLSDYAGKVVILNFWATWCAPCREEMPQLEALWQRYQKQGLVVLAVSEDRGRTKKVRKFIAKRGFTFPVALDRKSKIGRAYRVSGLPASALIDRHGNVVGNLVGFRDWAGEDAHALVQALLKQPE